MIAHHAIPLKHARNSLTLSPNPLISRHVMPSASAYEILDRVADEPYVTTAIAAKAIGVGKSTLQRWAAKGLVTPALRTPGGQARWDIEDLKAQLRVPGAPIHRSSGEQPGASD